MNKCNRSFYELNSGSDVAKEAGVHSFNVFFHNSLSYLFLISFDHFIEERLFFDPGGNRIRPSRVR